MKVSTPSIVKVILVFIAAVWFSAAFAHASANVTLGWDANDPEPEGYRVFVREAGSDYDYAHPIWEDRLTTCTLVGLTEGVTYYFVVRAYEGDLESVDSEEVSYTPPLEDDDSETDTEDPDDDANGEADDDSDDADADVDDDSENDTNVDGDDDSGTDSQLDAPVIENISEAERVGLTPVLVCTAYFSDDDDDHDQTRWQISTETDFSNLILDATSTSQLFTYTVGEMLLDVDTTYYWRAQFIDGNDDASAWSDTATFTTITADSLGDVNLDGMIDDQVADESADVNANGIADALEHNIMTINTIEGQTVVGVETVSDSVTLVAVKSLSTESIADASIALGFGLVGFKLYLQDGVQTASVRIHFSTAVPSDAKLYKHTIETGWQEYENAVFADDGQSVTIVLEDGGAGDEDGVRNGIIVDPSGIAYDDESVTAANEEPSVSDSNDPDAGGGGGGCFISAGSAGLTHMSATSMIPASTLLLLTLVMGSATAAWARR